jgi:di/tricarboxylate transporter
LRKALGAAGSGKWIGIAVGIAIVSGTLMAPIGDISREGRLCLAFTLMSVAFWIFKVADSSFVAGLFITLLVVFKVGAPEDIFSAWTGTIMWFVIGSFLIGKVIETSGIGQRMTYWLILRFIRSFRSIIISVFVLSVVLALFIPNPLPRALILMGVMKEVAEAAHLNKRDTATVGLSVFAASIPTCFIFVIAAGGMNQLVLSFAGLSLGWVPWFKVMGVPGLVLTVVYCLIILVFFRSKEAFYIDKEQVRASLKAMGPLKGEEIRAVVWIVAAVGMWLTDGIHGINIAWTTLGVAMLMGMPYIGGLIKQEYWKDVPLGTMIYLTAAVAIGSVGTTSGMTQWITAHFFPSFVPGNVFLLALMVAALCMFLHVFLGSAITAITVIIPSMLLYVSGSALTPLACIMICYTAIFGHFFLSYQHINILLGTGEIGMYTEKENLRMALPLTVMVPLVIVLVEIPWWKLTGVI